MHGTKIGCAALLALIAGAGNAFAQEGETLVAVPGPTTRSYDVAPKAEIIQAPHRAFELGLSAGYTQPWGEIDRTRPIEPIAGPGFSPSLELGYRIDPRWSVGIAGQYHESTAHDSLANGSHVRGFATNINATYHIMPYRFIDPYVQVGTGYRALWELPTGSNNNLVVHGFELGRLQVGVDYRVSKDVALGPYLGADLNLFAWQHEQDARVTTSLPDKRVNTFLSAGVMARFDMAGTREPHANVAVTTPVYFEAATPPPAAEPAKPEQAANLTFSAEIREKCGVSDEKAFFDFDSANLGNTVAPLDAVAKCLTEGTLKGRNIVVIGHADPRGTERYNMKLGERRAEAVRDYLLGHGVSTSSIAARSRGEKDSVGTDEATWAIDRRVDVELAP